MVDNVTADPGTGGATFATDDISGVHYPYVKLVWGADNTVTLVGTGANAVPIQDGGNSLTVDGTITANAGTGTFTIGDGGGSITIDGTVDTELTTADLDTGAGTDTRAVMGLVYGADGGGVLVSTTNPLPVGDNGGSLTIDNATLAVVGAGGEASALRVTIASDSTGLVSVDDNGGSITVDGAVTLGAALPAGTNNIGDVDVLTVPAPLSTTGGGTEAAALRVTIANDSTGLVSVDDNGGSLTIDGTVGLAAGTNNIGDVDVLTVPASGKTIKRAVGTASASGNNTAITAPGASKVIKVMNYSLQAQGTVNAKFTDGAGGADLSLLWVMQAREGTNLSPQPIPQFHFKCTANTALVLNLSAAVSVGYEITYWDDDAS